MEGDLLHVGGHSYPLSRFSCIVVTGAGKATPAMAAAVEELLGDRITAGAINTKYGHSQSLTHIDTTECGHPIPDEAGVEGTRRMLGLLNDLDEKSLVVCLFSGGGSALMPAPGQGITLAQKQRVTQLLLECGASIDEINTVRKHLSTIKGGLLARHAQPATVISLLMSDVIGDRLDTIASGPTYPDPTRFEDCLEIADRFGLRDRLPAAVSAHLVSGADGEAEETPVAGDPCFHRTLNRVVGNNTMALTAAAQKARELGYKPLILSSRIAGDTGEAARLHVAIAEEVVLSGQPIAAPACLISGGETTVVVTGTGKGGRNQEFALAGATFLADSDRITHDRITLLSAGTDGTDGPTDAAGALSDGGTLARGQALGLDAATHLAANDSYPFFSALDDLVMTGPTGTNVMDLRLLLVS